MLRLSKEACTILPSNTRVEDSSERNVSGSLFSKNAKGMQRCFVPPFKGVLKRNSVFKDGS